MKTVGRPRPKWIAHTQLVYAEALLGNQLEDQGLDQSLIQFNTLEYRIKEMLDSGFEKRVIYANLFEGQGTQWAVNSGDDSYLYSIMYI